MITQVDVLTKASQVEKILNKQVTYASVSEGEVSDESDN